MKKNTARILFTIIMLCSARISFCQEKYVTGYILTLHGDTVFGEVDYRNWEKNPGKIYFKEKSGKDKSGFGPMDIKGFGVKDEIYESAIVETETSPFNTPELDYSSALTLVKDTAFLQVMVRGTKSLYYYKPGSGKEQFYIKRDSSFELLIHKKYLKDQDDRTVIVENKKYVGQLAIYLNDCPAIQQKANGADYKKSSLEGLFLDYYKCVMTGMSFHKKTAKVAVAFGVLAGVSMTSVKFRSTDSEYFDYLINAGYKPSVNFSAGLFMDVILAGNQGKWSIYNELILSSYKIDGRYDEYVNENKYAITYTTLGYSYVKMNNMLRFKYPVGKFFLFLNAGISNGYAVSETNYMRRESRLFTQVRIEEGKALNETRRYEMGLIAGLGTKFWKFSFEIRYENGNGMSAYTALKSTANRLYCLLGYRF